MQEAEGYYQELKAQRLWSKKGVPGPMYINEATIQDHEENSILAEIQENVENRHNVTNEPAKGITALTLQLKKLNKKIHKKNIDQKYKWKLIPPKSGESSTKLIKPREQGRQEYQQRKAAYMEATAALQELNFSSDEETEAHTDIFEDTDSDSNTSDSTEYFSDVDSNTS
jgi:hypothetical protein